MAIDTKDRILDAAETLFADQGFSATSLRAITTAAEANLAAVNYHFGSKEGLIEAVLARRVTPLNRERLDQLDRLEGEAGDAGPDLEGVVEAFVGPALRMRQDATKGGAVFMRLLGHTISQPDDQIRQILMRLFGEIIPRFTGALGRRMPDLSAADVFWRFLFMIGAMAHTMAWSEHIPVVSDGLCDTTDAEATIRQLVPFVAAGMRSTAAAGKEAS